MVREKIKILHLVESFGGGVFTIVKAIAEGTCEEFDVTVAFAWRPQTPLDFAHQMNPEVHLIPLQNFEREINLKRDMKAYIEARRLIAELKPDILHLHSSKAGILGRLAADCKKLPVLYTPHGYSFQKKDDKLWKRVAYKWIEKLAAKFGGMTVACSKGEWITAKTITDRAIYINNGIDIKKLPVPKQIQNRKSGYRFCTIGRVCAQKNPEAFNEIARAFPNEKFIWIGEGELEYLLTSPNITITGWKEPEEALEILNGQDIFLLPSLWEGLSVALLEAMYLRCVCIASNIPGTREVIQHGKNGFLAGNVQEYIEIIQEFLSGTYDLRTITEEAHEVVLKKFTVEIMCRNYSKLYRKLSVINE